MEKRETIPRETIVCENRKYIYFKRGGKVFRGAKRPTIGGSRRTGVTRKSPTVIKSTIELIESISRYGETKTINALKKHGVKPVYRR